MKSVQVCFLAILAPLLLVTHALGAVIAWDAAPTTTDINNVTQVLNNGTYFTSYNAYNANLTLNGVHFVPDSRPANVGTFSVTNGFLAGPGPTTPYSYLSSAVLNIANTTAATGPIEFINLTVGQTYEIQIWGGYYSSTTTVRYSSSAPDGLTNSNAPNESPSLAISPTAGQFIVGTWLADATTQDFYYFGSNGTGELDAFQVRAIDPVPEPQTWALAALGASAVLFRLRRKQRAA